MTADTLSDEELERYARHILLAQVGGPGQRALKRARVLVVGAGGLGSPAILYLAAAGVGTIGIIDDDRVALSNLQRQIIHGTGTIGTPKPESAAKAVAALNPHVRVETHYQRLGANNAPEVIGHYDIVLDGCDNFATRYLVSDACYFAKKPLVSAAVAQFDGHVTTFKPYARDDDGAPLPSYRCFVPEAPPPGLLPSCEEAGILGALTGIIGSIQAIETIKEIIGIGKGLAGRLLIYDALEARTRMIALPWRADNPLNGENPTIHDLSAHENAEGP